jgi:hypothetical protein
MSGGRWGYRELKYRFLDESDLHEIMQLLQAVGECLHRIDYAECGDSSREKEEKRVYDILLDKADELWLG